MQISNQRKQVEWFEQWSLFQDKDEFLLHDWIYPNTLEQFRGLEVLEAGCGGGQHTSFIAPFAKNITAVDLNTTQLARERNKSKTNIQFIEADIATMDLKKQFDIVISIGVVHHTNDPNTTVENLIRHVKPGGKLILWVYSQEGNFLIKYLVEPLRRIFFCKLSRNKLYRVSQGITAAMMLPIHTIYRLPLRFLPYYEYFKNFRKLSFSRNVLNVFDKLNAPQVDLISRARAKQWLSENQFEHVHLSPYCGVSWRISGKLKK